MVHTCVVAGCPNRRRKTNSGFGNVVSFHLFPLNDNDLCQKWISAVGGEGFQPNKYSAVCSLHFKDSDIVAFHDDNNSTRRKSHIGVQLKRRYLRKDAVPFLHLTNPTQHSQQQYETLSAIPNDNKRLDFDNATAIHFLASVEHKFPKVEAADDETLEAEQNIPSLESSIYFEERAPVDGNVSNLQNSVLAKS